MSARDAVGRRRFAVESLIQNMRITEGGWTVSQMVSFIVREYGYGIRDKTADGIIKQLAKHGRIYKKSGLYYVKKTRKQTQ